MIRTFIFCDRCNPMGIRIISNKSDPTRRISDERAWFEGTTDEAKKEGWIISISKHTCPCCIQKYESKSPKLQLIKK